MSTLRELKESLLLTHGTVYGDIAADTPWIDYAGKSDNIDLWGSTTFWLTNIPGAGAFIPSLYGPMTDQTPIDVIHWSMIGSKGETGMEWWQSCLSMLRHL